MHVKWSVITLLATSVFVLDVNAGPPGAPGVQEAASARKEPGRFTLAVLRRDAVVIPFAHFNGRRWSNPWQVPGKQYDIPLTMPDVPEAWWPGRTPINEWTVWPLQGSQARVESTAPVTMLAHCQRGLGIRTTYKPAEAPPPEMMQPYPKDGLATSGDVAIESTPVIQPAASEWKAVEGILHRELTSLETRAIRSIRNVENWSHPASAREREKTPFSPEVIVRVSGRAIYFEGVKTYAKTGTPTSRPDGGWTIDRSRTCSILTYAAGWVLFDEAGKPKVKAAAEITDCNREGMVYTLPLGLIRRDDTVYWVTQVSGYGYERYEVLEVNGDEVKSAIATPGGWCG